MEVNHFKNHNLFFNNFDVVKHIVHLLILLQISFVGYAQKTKQVTTTFYYKNKIVNNVTVLQYNAADSTLTNTYLSNNNKLQIEVTPNTSYYITLNKDSFVTQYVPLLSPNYLLADSIVLEKRLNIDGEIMVIATNPITIKEDTIQFNNELFKKDSLKTLEEVLKKFPGVIIDRDGNIEINGQKITEILLEGKPLPINDIKALTQTLQAGLIDKIQFIDKRTDESKLTKIENGQRDKVINIKLKSKKKNSYNQDIYAGAGTNNRKEARTNANYLHNDMYANATLNYNNTGRSNYGGVNYFNPNGISKGTTSNISVRYTGFKKWTVGASVNYANQKTLFEEQRDRIIFLKDSNNLYTQNTNSTNNTNTVSTNINIQFTPDTLGDIRLNISANQSNGNNERNEYFNTTTAKLNAINNGQRQNDGTKKSYFVSAAINGGRRTRNEKFSFYTNNNISINNNDDNTLQLNNITYFKTLGNTKDTTNQTINNKANTVTARLNITGYIKLYKGLKLSVGNGISYTNRPSKRIANLYNYTTQTYTIPNTILQNDLENTTNTYNQTLGLIYNITVHTLSASVSYNQQINKNKDLIKDTTFYQNNKYITPNLNYTYYAKKINITANTSFSQRPPTSNQLQPIIDNTNPLYVVKGNPNLRNEQTINNTLQINKKQSSKGFSFNMYNNLLVTNSKIANNTFFDIVEGKQIVQPINLPRTITNNSTFSANKYFTNKKINIGARLNITFARDNNYLNNVLNELKSSSVKPSLNFKITKKKYYIAYDLGYQYQRYTYSIRPTQNLKLGNITTDASIIWYGIKNTEITFDYAQTVNNNRRSLQQINNLNIKLAYTPKWKPKTTFAISFFDVLNQNSNIRQSINDFYEESITTNAVRRFILASVLIKLSKFKAKK